MFRCQLGKHLTEPNEPLVRLVVESRPVKYLNDRGESKGTEIVRTIVACAKCAKDSPLKRI